MNTTTTDLISQSLPMTVRQIAEVAEKQGAGYGVPVLTDDGTRADAFTDIRFRRHASGRRNKSVVEGTINGRLAAFNSDDVLRVLLT